MINFPENPHTAEVAHDTELLKLLLALAERQSALSYINDRVLSSVAVYVSHQGEASVPLGGGRSERRSKHTLTVGTIYEQAKTFQRGEAGFYIVTGESEVGGERRIIVRRALVADAAEALDERLKDYDPESMSEIALQASGLRYLARLREDYAGALQGRLDALVAVQEHEKAYTGWSRYFLVTSSSGHVHATMACSTCRATTGFAPVVALSGCTEDEAVAALGERLCTVCFPTAPVGEYVPSLAALSDFDPNGEYGENTVDPFDAYWKQQSDQWLSEQADSLLDDLLDDLHNGGTIWGDEPDLRPLHGKPSKFTKAEAAKIVGAK